MVKLLSNNKRKVDNYLIQTKCRTMLHVHYRMLTEICHNTLRAKLSRSSVVQKYVIKNGMTENRLVASDGDLVLFIRFGKWSNGLDHAHIVSPAGARAHVGQVKFSG